MSQDLVTKIRLDDRQFKSIVDKVKNEVSSTEKTFRSSSGSIKRELRTIQEELSNMLLSGVDPASEKFQLLSNRAGAIQDAMGDARSVINDFGNDTRGLTNVLDVAGTGVAAFQVYAGSLAMLGVESKEVSQTLAQLAGAMSLLNGIQQIQAQLLDQSTGTYKAYHAILRTLGIEQTKSTTDTALNTTALVTNSTAREQSTTATAANTSALKASTSTTTAETSALNINTTAVNATATAHKGLTVAQKVAAGSSKILRIALASIGIGLIITAVSALITNWEDIVGWFKKTFPVTDKLGAAFDKLKQVMAGISSTIVYIASNIVELSKTIGKLYLSIISGVGIFNGSAKEAFNDLKKLGEGAKNAFTLGFNEKGSQIEQQKLEAAMEKRKEKIREDYEDRKAKYGENTREEVKYYESLLSLTKKGTKDYTELQRNLWTAKRKYRDEQKKINDDILKNKKKYWEEQKKINEGIERDQKDLDRFINDSSVDNRKNASKIEEDNTNSNYRTLRDSDIKTQEDLDKQLRGISHYYQKIEKKRNLDLVADKEAVIKKYDEQVKKAHGNIELLKRLEDEKNNALLNADVKYFNELEDLRRQKAKEISSATGKLIDPKREKLTESANNLNSAIGLKYNTDGIDQGGEALKSYIDILQDKLKINIGVELDYEKLDSAGFDRLADTFRNVKESVEATNKAREVLEDGLSRLVGSEFNYFLREAENLKKVLSSNIATDSDKIASSMVAMGGALQSLGQDSAAAKAGLVLAAIGQIVLGFAQATAKDAKLGVIGWIAAITAGMAVMISTISQLSSFSQGGIFKGNSRVGDQNLARVNAGEMILTRTQQGNLMRLLDNNTAGLGGGVGVGEVRIKGSDLYLALSNYSKIKSKTGKLTGIN